MNFTTPIFIFIFLPITILIVLFLDRMEQRKILRPFLIKFRIKDLSLIALSLFFYMWACFDDVIKFTLYIIGIWLAGRLIERKRDLYVQVFRQNQGNEDNIYKKISISAFILLFVVMIILFCLIHFKYMPLLAEIWNKLFRENWVKDSIMAPIGISFITFSSISYLVDIYRGNAGGRGIIDCVLYLTFFPKVISGPIVLWKDFEVLLENRRITVEGFVSGLNRIALGFAKKLILADQFGVCISKAVASETDMATGWGMAFLYMLQIYYDFSGYSDIAIGIARLLGFELRENFNFPYCSESISEFWRRWHISLGMWFREYIYFPLGGSRRGERRAIWNIAVVFALTGIWHGAGWNYLLWGGMNGVMVIIERMVKNKKFYQKQPYIFKWFITMSVTFFGWQFFRFHTLEEVWEWLKLMFGILQNKTIYYSWEYFFDAQIVVLAIIGIIGSILLGGKNIQEYYHRFSNTRIGFMIQEVVVFSLFITAILFMVNSTYSPFIYFRY